MIIQPIKYDERKTNDNNIVLLFHMQTVPFLQRIYLKQNKHFSAYNCKILGMKESNFKQFHYFVF